MTANQIIKKLNAANIDTAGIEIKRDEVEIYVKTKGGEFSQRLTEAKMNKVSKLLGWSGYKSGYGAWVLRVKTVEMGSFNDKGSRYHY